ncbi:hypothetical protein [Nitratireductor thuwali]|uniref:CdiI immunity protein domain-containing protein n=1 Tax=Nitratireductor thuwali TaxID=2267699 RepID=A0ABY5MPA8_9HYPH|nr:hypothetical protein NTH_03396 [Nitratireductor thuwali]
MKIPDAFRRMARHMHADVDLVVRSEDELPDYLAGALTPHEQAMASRFVEELLAADPSDAELAEIWSKTGSDCYIHNGYARRFYTDLLEALRSQQRSGD